MQSMPVLQFPWQLAGQGVFHWKSCAYLLIVYHYSDFFEVDRLTDTLATVVAQSCDHGPQFTVSQLTSSFLHTEIEDRSLTNVLPLLICCQALSLDFKDAEVRQNHLHTLTATGRLQWSLDVSCHPNQTHKKQNNYCQRRKSQALLLVFLAHNLSDLFSLLSQSTSWAPIKIKNMKCPSVGSTSQAMCEILMVWTRAKSNIAECSDAL